MTKRQRSEKPEKPAPDFPLSAHPCGQWAKKVHNKLHYFGPWDDPEGAIVELNRRWPEITGQLSKSTKFTIKQMCDAFLDSKEVQVKKGRLKQRTWNDYRETADRLVRHFGSSREIESLGARDFESLFEALPSQWVGTTLSNFVIRTKAILNYAYNEELVTKPVRTGTVFKRASADEQRIARANAPRKFFEANEILALIEGATPPMRAMIYCAVNLGYGNADCARLTYDMIRDGWVVEPRQKTGVLRMGKLWPQTIAALDEVISKPRKARSPGVENLVFVTRLGNPYWTDGGHDAISTAFYRLRTKCDVRRKNVGFYSLRHVTQTIGEQARDDTAVKVVMGHIDPSISERYREDFPRDRVEKVCKLIGQWLFADQKFEF